MLGGEIRWVSLPSFCISLIRWFSLRELSAEFVMRRVLADLFVFLVKLELLHLGYLIYVGLVCLFAIIFSKIVLAASWISFIVGLGC